MIEVVEHIRILEHDSLYTRINRFFTLIKVDWLIKQDQQLDIETEKYCNNKTGNYVLGSQPASI